MAKQWQIRRGTESENNNFTGALGEVTMDTTNNTLRVHDGVTQGGHVIGKSISSWNDITDKPSTFTPSPHTHDVSDITDFPELATVATSGDYDDLSNKPTIPAAQVNSDWNANSGISQILNKPELATIATSGNYDDLSNKPTIPTKTSDLTNDSDYLTSVAWNDIDNKPSTFTPSAHDHTVSEITDFPELATVATSGSYNDLTDKPSIPTIASDVSALPDTTNYGASLSLSIDDTTYVVTATLKDQNGNTLGTAQTIDLPLESVVVNGHYDSTNKKVILTLKDGSEIDFSVADLVSGLQTEITSANKLDADLIDDSTSTNKFVSSSDKTNWNSKVDASSLATVATSGSYNDLTDKPTIPSAQVNSDWNASSGIAQILNKPELATVATSGNYNDLSNKPTIPTVNNPTITITQGGVTKGSFTLNQASGDTIALDAGGGSSGVEWAIYGTTTHQQILDWANAGKEVLVKSINGVTIYRLIYVTVSVHIFTTANLKAISYCYVDSQNVWYSSANNLQVEIPAGTAGNVITYTGTAGSIGSATLATVATSGDYNDLSNKPTIPTVPTNVSAFNNDAGYLTEIDWSDINDKPSTFTPSAHSHTISDISNFPTLSTVATSGDYDDLSNKPTIPAAQVQTDWNATTGMGVILNKPSTFTPSAHNHTVSEITDFPILSTVATSGDYEDLSNTPTNFTGTDGTDAGTQGLVPAPAVTDTNKYLKSDGTWAIVESTVTGIDCGVL